MPAVGEGVAPDARREAPGPGDLARDVGHGGAQRAVAIGLQDGLVVARLHQRLGGGPQPRAQQHAIGAQRQRSRQPPPIANAAGGQQQRARRVRGQVIGRLGHEAQRAARGAVPAGLGPLRHHDVGLHLHRVHHMAQVLALADHAGPGGADLVHERPRVAERQHHRRRAVPEHIGQQRRRLAQRPGDEAHAHVRPGGGLELRLQPGRVAIAATDQPQAARAAHGCREGTAPREGHGGGHHRVSQIQHPGQPGRERCHGFSPVVPCIGPAFIVLFK